MNTTIFEARKHIAKAREALQRGDKETAWQLGRQAARLAPEMEDAWLVLTAADARPEKALAHARRALMINPESPRARQGWEWALARVQEKKTGNALVKQNTTLRLALRPKGGFARFPERSAAVPQLKTRRGNGLYLVLLAGVVLVMVVLLGLFVLARPVFASIVSTITAPAPPEEPLWAPVDIAKPVVTPLDVSVFGSEGALPEASISVPMEVPALEPAEAPTAIPEATETSGTMIMEIVNEDAPSQSGPAETLQANYPSEGNGERWIDVNLSEQRVYAYEGDVVVNSFLASTGVAQTPTVTGKYKIYVKVRIQDMSGPGYYLRDVPWVMFFYDEYGFHGTYWHNNFGTPMSRGCVNLTIDNAEWLYNWASVGTVVNIHY